MATSVIKNFISKSVRIHPPPALIDWFAYSGTVTRSAVNSNLIKTIGGVGDLGVFFKVGGR